MKRYLTLIPLLATMLVVAACGASDTGRSERADPVEPRRTQAESGQKSDPANDEPSGLDATTVDGEQVNLGGQGDVTALYFMAGW